MTEKIRKELYDGIDIKRKRTEFQGDREKIFSECCSLTTEITGNFLEEYDRHLNDRRGKKAYRDKGIRKSTVKNIYGEVECHRHVYETIDETGTRKYVYLLDGKVAFAGFSGSKEFHRIREAKIASEYNLDETQLRILNGYGAKGTQTIFSQRFCQLTLYRICKDVKTIVYI